MKKIMGVIILSAFLCSCASVGKQKTEIRTTQFQNVLGFAITGAGLAYGAYVGSRSADKDDQLQNFSYGLIGGILGGLVSGGVYYLSMQLIAERVDVPDNIEEPAADETILMPE
ncbi:MAG: hypothetical protein KA120_08775 [Candidatus Goldbacteria bacterium]|nr:hypothetical protein [Candidatus Goldiibacteriota bacterium]HPD18980.1 hypothetical protein [Candidatus Goldiibacteriota bacterium]